MRTSHKTLLAALALGSACLLLLSSGLMASEGGGGYDASRWKDFGLRVMNFAVFFAILFLLLRKPVKSFFRGRSETIARTMEYLETQARNLEEQNQVMKRNLSQLASERDGIIAQYERDGAKERDRIIAEARRTAEQIVQKAETAVAQEAVSARRELARQTGLMAVEIAGDVLAKNVRDEDKALIMKDFVSQITRLPARR
ncbi:MAG: ATP synthase F0 subunit B [Deltaproteobacteria bacterium]|jgi:F-type H+-transporting ATPase subunit b|nr:ATP synthase F0 subunit B [Deltaproteobacteria bacterium]